MKDACNLTRELEAKKKDTGVECVGNVLEILGQDTNFIGQRMVEWGKAMFKRERQKEHSWVKNALSKVED